MEHQQVEPTTEDFSIGDQRVRTFEGYVRHIQVYLPANETRAMPVLLLQGTAGNAWHDMDFRLGMDSQAAWELYDILREALQI